MTLLPLWPDRGRVGQHRERASPSELTFCFRGVPSHPQALQQRWAVLPSPNLGLLVRWGPDDSVSESPSARKRRGAKLVVNLG
jgi:hypothetical protein